MSVAGLSMGSIYALDHFADPKWKPSSKVLGVWNGVVESGYFQQKVNQTRPEL